MRVLALAAAIVYAVFALSCFHLATAHPYERGVSIGEGLFTLAGAFALAAAALMSRSRAFIALLGTLPLVGWFLATPWNSGKPFLVASLVVPLVAAAALVVTTRARPAS
jgi:hypothetical protein